MDGTGDLGLGTDSRSTLVASPIGPVFPVAPWLSNWYDQLWEHRMGMNVTLPPDLEQRVREKIARGDYDNSDALIQEAVHRLIEEDEGDLASLRARLRQADAEIDRGEGLEFDEDTTKELARDIHERGMQRLVELQKSSPRG